MATAVLNTRVEARDWLSVGQHDRQLQLCVPLVTTTVAWCRSRSRMLTAVVCSGRNRPHWSNDQCEAMASERRS